MRLIGLDYGSKTVGVALSDPTHTIASPLLTIERPKEGHLRKTLQKIEELCRDYEVEEVVIGLPLNMNQTEGERVEKTREFASLLMRRIGLPVVFWDERLTTVQAERSLIEQGVRREDRKKDIDSVAASLLLQSYLDAEMKGREGV